MVARPLPVRGGRHFHRQRWKKLLAAAAGSAEFYLNFFFVHRSWGVGTGSGPPSRDRARHLNKLNGALHVPARLSCRGARRQPCRPAANANGYLGGCGQGSLALQAEHADLGPVLPQLASIGATGRGDWPGADGSARRRKEQGVCLAAPELDCWNSIMSGGSSARPLPLDTCCCLLAGTRSQRSTLSHHRA